MRHRLLLAALVLFAGWHVGCATVSHGCGLADPDRLSSGEVSAADLEAAERVRGLLLGGFIGDALGGPVEFVPLEEAARHGSWVRHWQPGERLESKDLNDYGAELRLLPYAPWRPDVEPYGQWTANAPAGTLTDDTRHKLILLEALATDLRDRSLPLTPEDLARAYLQWVEQSDWSGRGDGSDGADRVRLAEASLGEYLLACRWVLGERDRSRARPPQRLWGGIGTCAGQMVFPPLAALHPGRPESAYLNAFDLAFIDNADGRDLNAAIVAGLAQALVLNPDDFESAPAAWTAIERVMIETDPYGYAEVPWVDRSVIDWLAFARDVARRADHQPAVLRRLLAEEMPTKQGWEAHVTLVMAVAAMHVAEHHPLASMRLAVELGGDTDSTAQLVGCFMGALHGPDVFPAGFVDPVVDRLESEYGQTMDDLVLILMRASENQGLAP